MYCLALGLLGAWYMCPGLNGKFIRVQEAAGVSGSHHTRFTLSRWRNQALPHHVSAFLNLSCANQRSPSSMGIKIPSTWLRNPRVRRVFRSWTPQRLGSALHAMMGPVREVTAPLCHSQPSLMRMPLLQLLTHCTLSGPGVNGTL